MSKKKKKDTKVNTEVSVDPNMVTCSCCGHKGHKDEFVVIAGDKKISNWRCLPRHLSGSLEGITPVCDQCAFKLAEQFRKDSSLWFKSHDRLPFLAQTIAVERDFFIKALKEFAKMKKFGQDIGLVVDKKRVCKHCGRFHGQLYVSAPWPKLYFRTTLVDLVDGRHDDKDQVIANAVCNDCKDKIKGESFFYNQTMDEIKRREREKPLPVKILGLEMVEPVKSIPIIGKAHPQGVDGAKPGNFFDRRKRHWKRQPRSPEQAAERTGTNG